MMVAFLILEVCIAPPICDLYWLLTVMNFDVIVVRWGLDLFFPVKFSCLCLWVGTRVLGRGCLTLPMLVPSPDRSGGGTSGSHASGFFGI